MDFLDTMAASSWARVHALEDRDFRDVEAQPRLVAPRDFHAVAEVKFRAPSAGTLGTPSVEAVGVQAAVYAEAGASAVSVLTEPTRFDGSLAFMKHASQVSAPVMRKDFLVDPVQVWEARAHGASGVLLIAAMLDDPALEAMVSAAEQAGLFVLLEAFSRDDLARCDVDWSSEQPLWVGVNCRDLRTLEVDGHRFERLAPHLPPGRLAIAESGLKTSAEVTRAAGLGYRGILVGSALMQAPDPLGKLRSMIAAGEQACG